MTTSDKDNKDFLSRWSERKAAVQEAEKSEIAKDLELPAADQEALPAEMDEAQISADGEPDFVPTEEDVEKLDINSDFSKFLKNSVPQHIKRMALQKLWRTDPAFAVVDGLLEYGEDYSDMTNKGVAIQTAYQAGKGYLNRDDKTGDAAPEDPVAAAAGEETGTSDVAADDAHEDVPVETASEEAETMMGDGEEAGNGEDDVA